MWKYIELDNILYKIFVDEMFIYYYIKIFNCKFFYFNLLIIGIWKEIFYLYFLKFNYVYICIYVVLVVYIFVLYDKIYFSIVKFI